MPVRIRVLVNSHSGATEGFGAAEVHAASQMMAGGRGGGRRPIRK